MGRLLSHLVDLSYVAYTSVACSATKDKLPSFTY